MRERKQRQPQTIDSKERRAAYAECHGKRKQHALLQNESAAAAAALLQNHRSLLRRWGGGDLYRRWRRCSAKRPPRLLHLLSALRLPRIGCTASQRGTRESSSRRQQQQEEQARICAMPGGGELNRGTLLLPLLCICVLL